MDVSGEELTFALGSCLHQDEPQPIWNAIQEEKLDGFIFLGDNVYGDSPSYKLEKMARSYDRQKDNFPNWLNEIEIWSKYQQCKFWSGQRNWTYVTDE